ncbi:MAG: acetate/propionate family kinase [Candidatus Melainabacteria bacterium]|nr:acetate/propionate family kinase [Candidatus Melainabacteria bacterium]
MNIVVVNSGSSSLKMSMFQTKDTQVPLQAVWDLEQDVDWQNESAENIEQKINETLTGLWQGQRALLTSRDQIDFVGHRIVHGGSQYSAPVELTQEVVNDLAKLNEFAPLHNPINLSALKLVQHLLPNARHIAVFDTAFHSTLKPEAAVYPGPYSWYTDLKIKKYGFHGISHKYCSDKAAQILGQRELRIVSCHLGGGCSLAAVRDGVSVDTTMGFTPLDGLMMRSRSGAIDPGILIYLLKNNKYSVDELDHVLNKESGMKGIFERSADLRDITKAMLAGDERAKLTFDMFVHRLSGSIAAMITALGGLDVLLFTGGIGEHSSYVRAAACQKLSFLNLSLDEKLNNADPVDIDVAASTSPVRILVVKAREDWQIATECANFSGR